MAIQEAIAVIWRNVYEWLEEFKRAWTDDNDDEYSGLPTTAACVEVTERIDRLFR
jgi:hypothetical protein